MFGILATIGAVITAAVSVVTKINVLGLAIEGLKAICTALVNLVKKLGLVEPDMPEDELGDRAIQAEEQGIKPEDFKNYHEYVAKLSEVELNEKRSKEISLEDKIKKSIEVSTALTLERFPSLDKDCLMSLGEFLGTRGTTIFDERSYDLLADKISEADDGASVIKDLAGFVSDSEKDEASLERGESIAVEMFQAKNPTFSAREAREFIFGSRTQEVDD